MPNSSEIKFCDCCKVKITLIASSHSIVDQIVHPFPVDFVLPPVCVDWFRGFHSIPLIYLSVLILHSFFFCCFSLKNRFIINLEEQMTSPPLLFFSKLSLVAHPLLPSNSLSPACPLARPVYPYWNELSYGRIWPVSILGFISCDQGLFWLCQILSLGCYNPVILSLY